MHEGQQQLSQHKHSPSQAAQAQCRCLQTHDNKSRTNQSLTMIPHRVPSVQSQKRSRATNSRQIKMNTKQYKSTTNNDRTQHATQQTRTVNDAVGGDDVGHGDAAVVGRHAQTSAVVCTGEGRAQYKDTESLQPDSNNKDTGTAAHRPCPASADQTATTRKQTQQTKQTHKEIRFATVFTSSNAKTPSTNTIHRHKTSLQPFSFPLNSVKPTVRHSDTQTQQRQDVATVFTNSNTNAQTVRHTAQTCM